MSAVDDRDLARRMTEAVGLDPDDETAVDAVVKTAAYQWALLSQNLRGLGADLWAATMGRWER